MGVTMGLTGGRPCDIYCLAICLHNEAGEQISGMIWYCEKDL